MRMASPLIPATPLVRYCSCSQESITEMLARFPAEDQADMVENGEITVTCEFCSTLYRVSPGELGGLIFLHRRSRLNRNLSNL